MRGLARAVGFITLVAGAFLLASPEAARRMIRVRAEFAQLSPAALRMLGGWYAVTGALLVSATVSPAAEERAGKAVESGLRRAARTAARAA
ncbi:MAG: hypothetical protein ACYC66_12695 [Chloroflexota bacterium]